MNTFKAASIASFGLVLTLSACGGQSPHSSSGLTPIANAPNSARHAATTAVAAPATGAQLATIQQRRAKGASHDRTPRINQVVGAGGGGGGGGGGRVGGGAHGVSCKGGCVGGTSTSSGGGTLYSVSVTAPTAGTYNISGYTTDSNGVQTPIPAASVTVSDSQAGPTETVVANAFIPDGVDMSNGISITITGPNGNDDPFDPNCDTGTGSWDFGP